MLYKANYRKIKDNLENNHLEIVGDDLPACKICTMHLTKSIKVSRPSIWCLCSTYMISTTTERMKLAGVWGIPSASFKSFRRSEKQFQAIKVLIFKPDHCCRKIKSPLRFLQTHMRSNNLN